MWLVLTSYTTKSGWIYPENTPRNSRARVIYPPFLQKNFRLATVTGPDMSDFDILHHPIRVNFSREHLQKQTGPRNRHPVFTGNFPIWGRHRPRGVRCWHPKLPNPGRFPTRTPPTSAVWASHFRPLGSGSRDGICAPSVPAETAVYTKNIFVQKMCVTCALHPHD